MYLSWYDGCVWTILLKSNWTALVVVVVSIISTIIAIIALGFIVVYVLRFVYKRYYWGVVIHFGRKLDILLCFWNDFVFSLLFELLFVHCLLLWRIRRHYILVHSIGRSLLLAQ